MSARSSQYGNEDGSVAVLLAVALLAIVALVAVAVSNLALLPLTALAVVVVGSAVWLARLKRRTRR